MRIRQGKRERCAYSGTGASPVLGRVEEITDSSGNTVYARYGYLGAGTIVSVEHPAVTNGLTLSYDPAGDHSFGGWDRFGRVVDQEWTTGTNATVVDEFTYTYDRNSNRMTRGNALNSDYSETYQYDGLDRLTDTQRAGSAYQSWQLDQLRGSGTTRTSELVRRLLKSD